MSYNPNKSIDTDVCKGIEKLFDALRRKGVVLKGIELSKPLELFGEPTSKISVDLGMHFNKRHIKVTAPSKPSKEKK